METLPNTAIAKIVKSFGAKGELVVRLYDLFPEQVDFKEPVFVIIDGLSVPLFFNTFEKRGPNKALVIFDDITSEYRSMELIGKELLCFDDSQELEQDDELCYEDMIGFTLIDVHSGRSGRITEHVDYANNPLFGVDFDGVEVMIPIAEDLIRSIDPERKTIEMMFPEGLLELYAE